MSVQFEIHDNLAEQPSEILEKLLATPRLCLLLNPELSERQVNELRNAFYVVEIEHESEQRFAILAGFYHQPYEPDAAEPLRELWKELKEEDDAERI